MKEFVVVAGNSSPLPRILLTGRQVMTMIVGVGGGGSHPGRGSPSATLGLEWWRLLSTTLEGNDSCQ